MKKTFKQKSSDKPGLESIETLIGPGTVFEGALDTETGVSVEGVFRGRLHSRGGIVVNKVGRVEADIVADYVVIHGTVIGNVTAIKQIDIGSSGNIKGDVQAGSVTVARGGILDGVFKMLSPKSRELLELENAGRFIEGGVSSQNDDSNPSEIVVAAEEIFSESSD